MNIERRQKVEYNIDGEWVLNEELCSYCGRNDNSTQFLYQIHGDMVCEDESCVYGFLQSYCDEVIDINSPDVKWRIAPKYIWELKKGDIVKFTEDKEFYFFDKIPIKIGWKNLVGVVENISPNVIRLGEYTSGDKKGEREKFSPISYRKFTTIDYGYDNYFESDYSYVDADDKAFKNATLFLSEEMEEEWHFELLDENRTDLL